MPIQRQGFSLCHQTSQVMVARMHHSKHRSRLRRATAILATAASLALSLVSIPGPSLAAPSQAELEAAQDRLMELEREFELVVERYNLVHEELDALRSRIAAKELEVTNIEKRMATKQDAAIDLATELYKGGGASGIEVVLSSESLADIDKDLAYLESSEEQQSEVFEDLDVARQELNAKIASLDKDRAKASAEEARLEEMRVDIEAKVEDQRDEITELNALIEAAERRARIRAERAARAEARAAAAAVEAAPDPAVVPNPAPAPNGSAQAAVDAALSQVGKPYVWAAAGPDSYDCSGLTMWAWAQAGVSLPHNSGMQYAATPRVSQSDWQPGDLLFFGSPIHHVAMYIGGGQMVEAPYSGSQVRVVSAYRSDYVGAGRP
jgi:cell wall-associated NlpC family hydrolase